MAWQDDVLKIALANPDVIVPAEALGTKATKRNKYNNVRCEFQGMKFDSKRELARWGELRLLEMTNLISDLQFHPVFALTGGVKYEGDFQYIEDGKNVCEDVKGANGKGSRRGTITQTFINKWKQVKVLYPSVEFRLIEK